MTKKNNPLISVIMPVYNTEKYLPLAIESILNQTYSNFEFLIFDDGSSDCSPEIIKEYASKDNRITAYFSPMNTGYLFHLNEGLRLAKGDFVARMDSDDIAYPNRFAEQLAFLQEHESVVVLGTCTIPINEDGKEVGKGTRPLLPKHIFWDSFFTNPLCHPTVMFRSGIFKTIGQYDIKKYPAEDHDLWLRILRQSDIANLGTPLLKYRLHTSSVSVKANDLQLQHMAESLINQWMYLLNRNVSYEEAIFFRDFHKGYDDLNPAMALNVFRHLLALRKYSNRRYGNIDGHIRGDFFRKGIYLATKAWKNSFAEFVVIFSYFCVFYTGDLLRFFKERTKIECQTSF